MVKFISADRSVQDQLAEIGQTIFGSLDDQVPVQEFYIAYSDRQLRRVGQYVPRTLRWNVRVRSQIDVHSIGWYKTPSAALLGLQRAVEISRSLQLPGGPDLSR